MIESFARGDTRKFRFEFMDTSTPPIPIDITGWKMFFTMKTDPKLSDAQAIVQIKTIAGDDVLDDPVNGIMHITLDSVNSALLSVQSYFYDFQSIVPGNPPIVTTEESGKVKILQDVTIDVI